MAWIESHQSVGDHPKTERLANLLDVNVVQAVGHLHFLWWWALNYAQDGNLTRYTPREIAKGARWERDADVFVNALVESEYADRVSKKLVLHDWYDYAGKLIERREKDAQRKRVSRGQVVRETWTSERRPADIHTPSACTVPNQPNQPKEHDHLTMIEPVSTEDQIDLQLHVKSVPSRKTDDYTDDFVAFWDAYPRPIGKREAFKKWQARLREGVSPFALIHAAERYATECTRRQTEPQFIKHPSTFLGPNKHYEDYMQDTPTEEPPQQKSALPPIDTEFLAMFGE